MKTHPLRGPNKLKLGVFSFNGGGGAFTNHPDRFEPTWENNVRIAQLADRLGLEAVVPYAKWKAFAGDGHYSGRTYETFTWAAGLAALTEQIAVMSTVHVPVYGPLLTAKLAATLDHISGGRCGINIVCGWFKPEIEMFGSSITSHEDRYGAADEWVQLVERLWTEDKSFDFEGKFYSMKQAFSDPKPLGARPMLMNAGGSDRGKEFAAQNCDIAFILPFDPRPEAIKAQVDGYRKLAREKYGREIQVWTYGYCVQRDTVAQAKAYVDEYAGTYGDTIAADNFIAQNVANAKTVPPGVMEKMRYSLMAGIGSYPLLGNPDDISSSLGQLSDAGLDGVLLMWLDYEGGLQRFGDSVLPRLIATGHRQPAM
jgi:FMNH2-dependent dimethyl sulfone monooxygenase